MEDFNGQVAIVTGAASGIGLAIAKMLLSRGARVALFDLNRQGLQEEFGRYGDSALPIFIDVTDQALVEKIVGDIAARYAKIDILVNCAGITGLTNMQSHEVDSDDLHKVFEINFMSSFYTSRAVLPHMISKGYGRILHIASISGKEGNVGMLAYSASKAAVI